MENEEEIIKMKKEIEKKMDDGAIKSLVEDIKKHKDEYEKITSNEILKKKITEVKNKQELYKWVVLSNFKEHLYKDFEAIEACEILYKIKSVIEKMETKKEKKEFLRKMKGEYPHLLNNIKISYFYKMLLNKMEYLYQHKNCFDFDKTIKNLEKENKFILEEDMIVYTYDASVECTLRDNDTIIPFLKEDFVLVANTKGYDGGFKNRLTYRFFEVLDKDKLNGKTAVLFRTGLVTYYKYKIRGLIKKTWLAGYDDGHVFLTQVYNTCKTVKEAVYKLIPSEVKKAQEQGTETKRWGDIWFIKTNKKLKGDEKIEEIMIRAEHKILGFRKNKTLYAIKAIAHSVHPAPELEGAIWKVARNKLVSRKRVYD